MIAQCFYGIYFHCEIQCSVRLFNFGLGLGLLNLTLTSASTSASRFWPRPRPRPQVFGLGLGLKYLASFNISEKSFHKSVKFL